MRRLRDNVFWVACGLAFVIIAAPCISVVVSVFHQAAPSLGWSLLTKNSNGATGGLRNAIEGTLVLLVGVLVVAGTIGVAGGIFLAEFAPPRISAPLRFLSEILAGMPSIVIGYVGYVALVVGFHWGNSLIAAILALSVLVLPYVVKTTEVALRQVPSALREGSAALGLPLGRTIWRVLLPPALPAIVTGLIVALAISTGETAPLLFTAGFSNVAPVYALHHSAIGYLTGITYMDLQQPGAQAHSLAAAAGAVTLVILGLLIAAGRLVSVRARRSTERMSL